jgi:hypothetical protein
MVAHSQHIYFSSLKFQLLNWDVLFLDSLDGYFLLSLDINSQLDLSKFASSQVTFDLVKVIDVSKSCDLLNLINPFCSFLLTTAIVDSHLVNREDNTERIELTLLYLSLLLLVQSIVIFWILNTDTHGLLHFRNLDKGSLERMHAFMIALVGKAVFIKRLILGGRLKLLIVFVLFLVAVKFVVHNHQLEGFKSPIGMQTVYFSLVEAVVLLRKIMVYKYSFILPDLKRIEHEGIKHNYSLLFGIVFVFHGKIALLSV